MVLNFIQKIYTKKDILMLILNDLTGSKFGRLVGNQTNISFTETDVELNIENLY